MTTRLVTITPDTTYEGAAKLMHAQHLRALPVLDAQGKVLGVLWRKNMLKALYPDYGEYFVHSDAYHQEHERQARVNDVRKEPIQKFMSTTYHSVEPSKHLLLAGGIMLSKDVFELLVMKDDKLVGIVTREDLFQTILKEELGY